MEVLEGSRMYQHEERARQSHFMLACTSRTAFKGVADDLNRDTPPTPSDSRELVVEHFDLLLVNTRSDQHCSRRSALGVMETKQPVLQVTFGGLLSKNMDQLKMLNAAIFPIKYQVHDRPSRSLLITQSAHNIGNC